MKRSTIVALAALAFFAVPNLTSAMPTIYPRGTTIYDPEKCWNGYTVISMNGNNKEMGGSYLVDMNGMSFMNGEIFSVCPVKFSPMV